MCWDSAWAQLCYAYGHEAGGSTAAPAPREADAPSISRELPTAEELLFPVASQPQAVGLFPLGSLGRPALLSLQVECGDLLWVSLDMTGPS